MTGPFVPQGCAQSGRAAAAQGLAAALAEWRTDFGGLALEADLRAFASGTGLHELPQLADLFSPGSQTAAAMADQFIAAVAGGLRREPGAVLPLRHFSNDQFAALVLARSGTAVLSLQAVRRCVIQAPSTATFSPLETRERILTGAGEAVLLDRAGQGVAADVCQTKIALHAGVIITRVGGQQNQVITRVDQPLLVLRLQRAQPGCEPSRIIDLRSGQMVRQAAGKLADTRLELAAAVLGQMDHRAAAAQLAGAAVALDGHGPAARWQALRAALALDSQAGFAALTVIAGCRNDPLAEPARALREELLGAWPQLLECASCR